MDRCRGSMFMKCKNSDSGKNIDAMQEERCKEIRKMYIDVR
jgi:hypothetical protein